MIGVGNVPVELKGVTRVLELEDVDVILVMDIIGRLDVQISGRSREAKPRPENISCEVLRLN